MYLPEMRPWLVGKRPNPPPEECGLAPLLYDPAMRWESGRTEPVKAPPEERELWWLDANALLCCSGREKPWPSWMVTTKMPGFLTTGACDRASAPPGTVSLVGVVAPGLVPFSSLSVMVEVDGDRENALSGPRCVSLSFLVSFHDMVTVPARPLDGMEQIK